MPPSTPRVVPRSKDFTWTGGWAMTSPGQRTAIATRYTPQNPNLKTGTEDTDMLDAAQIKADADMTTAANTAQGEQNLAAAETRGNIAAAGSMLPAGTTNVVQPGQVAGATVPAVAPTTVVAGGGPVVNPNTGGAAAQAEQNWMDRGGSMATMHRAQVARGYRPAIDARATPAWQDAGPSASDEIRGGFGSGPGQEGHSPWPASDFGNAGSAVWADMTQKFNQNKAKLRQSLTPAGAAGAAGGAAGAASPNPRFTAGSSGEDAAAFGS